MLSHYTGCRFARLAGNPRKIVISDGNGTKKPGDHVATVADEELAEELVHLWNEGHITVKDVEDKETTPEIEAFIDDVRNTLKGPEGKPTEETIQLIIGSCDTETLKEIVQNTFGEKVNLTSKTRNDLPTPEEVMEQQMEKREEHARQEKKRIKKIIKEAVGEEIYNAMPVVGLLAGAFKDEMKLLESLIDKCEHDMRLKKILVHTKNKIVTNKALNDGNKT